MIEILNQFSGASGQPIRLIAIILFIFGVLQCFFGYRIFKFWIAVCGFLTFGILGGLMSVFVLGSSGAGMFFGLLFAIGGAYISFKIYKVGVFTLCGLMGFLLTYILTQSIVLSIILGLGVGILSQFFVKPVIILSTSVSGGFTSAMSLLTILKVDSNSDSIVLSIVFSIGGILIQFALHKIETNTNPCLSKINSPKHKSITQRNPFSSCIKNKIKMDNLLVAKEVQGVTFDEVCQNLLEVLYSTKCLKTIMPFIDYILYFVSILSIGLSIFIFTEFNWINSTISVLLFVGILCFIKKKYIALAISFSLVTISRLMILASSLSILHHSQYSIPYYLIDTAIIGYVAFESIKYFVKSGEGILLKNAIQGLFQKQKHTSHTINTPLQSINEIKIMIRCPNCAALNSEVSKFCDSCGTILIIEKKAIDDTGNKDIDM